MNWMFYQIAATLISAGSTILDKKLATRPDTPPLIHAASFGIVGAPVVMVGLATLPPVPWTVALTGMLAGVLFIVAAWLYYGAMARAEVSQVTLLMRLTSVQTLLLSAVFLGEQLTPMQYKAFAAMSLGGLLVLYEPGQAGPRLNKAVAWILLATSLLALESVLSATIYREHSLWAGIVWEKAGQILGTLALVGLTRDKRRLVQAARTGGLPLWGTLLGEQTVRLVVGILSGVVIVQGVPLALVSALGGLRLVFTLLLAAWLLRERWPIETLFTRLGGSGCIVLGLVLMV